MYLSQGYILLLASANDVLGPTSVEMPTHLHSSNVWQIVNITSSGMLIYGPLLNEL